MDESAFTPGGAFLFAATPPASVFTPEKRSPQQEMMAASVDRFIASEVTPHYAEFEAHAPQVAARFMAGLGSLGVLGVEIPERFGGLGLTLLDAVTVAEHVVGGSLSAMVGAHTGIGTLPLLYFGSNEQKARYLPGLAAGTLIGAYALTEPNAGSDARATTTRATRTPDGRHFLLDGAKQFITNAGIAGLITTYAKVDGEHLTAFLVEAGTPGLTMGPEEKKMGMHGSSTRALHFAAAPVPAENVLGEIGRAHLIAFNALNVGRLKLAALCLGNAKVALRQASVYAAQRFQFGKPINSFGLVEEKLARLAANLYASESMLYRTAADMSERLAVAHTRGESAANALGEYAAECGINKVFTSELAGEAADEAVQIFGGAGYMEELGIERAYRDARINRIWEGTNEINRLLILGMLLKRATKGELPLIEHAQAALMEPARSATGPAAVQDSDLLPGGRHVFLLTLGAALTKYGPAISEAQEVLAALSEIAIHLYAAESSVLRARQNQSAAHAELARSVLWRATARMREQARLVLTAVAQDAELDQYLATLEQALPPARFDRIELDRRIAAHVIERDGYPL